jgi:hypothetical protein
MKKHKAPLKQRRGSSYAAFKIDTGKYTVTLQGERKTISPTHGVADLADWMNNTETFLVELQRQLIRDMRSGKSDNDIMLWCNLWRLTSRLCFFLMNVYECCPQVFSTLLSTHTSMPTLYSIPETKADIDRMREHAKAIGLGCDLRLKEHSKTRFRGRHGICYAEIALAVHADLIGARNTIKEFGSAPSRSCLSRQTVDQLKQLPPLTGQTLHQWRGILEKEFLKRNERPHWEELKATCKRKDCVDYDREEYRERFYLDHCMQALRGLLATK